MLLLLFSATPTTAIYAATNSKPIQKNSFLVPSSSFFKFEPDRRQSITLSLSLLSLSLPSFLPPAAAEGVNFIPLPNSGGVKFLDLTVGVGQTPVNGDQIHGRVITIGLQQCCYLVPKIAAFLFKLKNNESVAFAEKMFDQVCEPNDVLWNVMFKGYYDVGMYKDTVLLFDRMMKNIRKVNGYTFTYVLKSISVLNYLRYGEQIHCFSVKSGWFGCNSFVGTMLIDMYSQSIGNANKVFEEMIIKNVVTWNAMVRVYISYGDLEAARNLFDLVVDKDVILWNTMIAGYAEKGHMLEARELFSQIPVWDRDTMSWNTVLNGYANADEKLVDECEIFFFKVMPNKCKNIFSWNGFINVYASHGRYTHTLKIYNLMLFSGIMPNEATLATILSACSKLGDVAWGRGIHCYMIKMRHNLPKFTCVRNGLIDMYAKCGCIKESMVVFESMKHKTRDIVTWNTIIGGLASHGNGIKAVNFFKHMTEIDGCKPDGITFVGVLSACVHSVGFVNIGIAYFQSMIEKYHIDPSIEHYGCMVDLFGRAGMICKAFELVKYMSKSIKPDSVIWSTLFGACQQQKHVGTHIIVAEIAMSWLVRLEPEDVTHYVMLANIYGTCGKWVEVEKLKRVIDRMCRMHSKLPGWSCLQLESSSQPHSIEFHSSDTRHLRAKEIYQTLHGLMRNLIPVDSSNFVLSGELLIS